jgi:hypothetical protein
LKSWLPPSAAASRSEVWFHRDGQALSERQKKAARQRVVPVKNLPHGTAMAALDAMVLRITANPTLPPESGAYVAASRDAGPFIAFGVCSSPWEFWGFKPLSSVIGPAGQDLEFNATYNTTGSRPAQSFASPFRPRSPGCERNSP